MAAGADEKWAIDKLDGANWTTWKFQMKHLLLAKELWRIVDGTEVLAVAVDLLHAQVSSLQQSFCWFVVILDKIETSPAFRFTHVLM